MAGVAAQDGAGEPREAWGGAAGAAGDSAVVVQEAVRPSPMAEIRRVAEERARKKAEAPPSPLPPVLTGHVSSLPPY